MRFLRHLHEKLWVQLPGLVISTPTAVLPGPFGFCPDDGEGRRHKIAKRDSRKRLWTGGGEGGAQVEGRGGGQKRLFKLDGAAVDSNQSKMRKGSACLCEVVDVHPEQSCS